MQVQRLSWFANWFCSLEDPPTAVVDGPNAAYMDQNHKEGGFMLQQASWERGCNAYIKFSMSCSDVARVFTL